MLGIVLISHGKMAEGMLDSAKLFFGESIEQLKVLSLGTDDTEDFREQLAEAINEVDTGDGVVILADLFGGTPCNKTAFFIGDKVNVVSGMNLPMLVELLGARMCGNVNINSIVEAGEKGIVYLNQIKTEDLDEDF